MDDADFLNSVEMEFEANDAGVVSSAENENEKEFLHPGSFCTPISFCSMLRKLIFTRISVYRQRTLKQCVLLYCRLFLDSPLVFPHQNCCAHIAYVFQHDACRLWPKLPFTCHSFHEFILQTSPQASCASLCAPSAILSTIRPILCLNVAHLYVILIINCSSNEDHAISHYRVCKTVRI